MVVEVAPGSYGAFFDLWQQTNAGVGPFGADQGPGEKFLLDGPLKPFFDKSWPLPDGEQLN
jgi:hypothetical protein